MNDDATSTDEDRHSNYVRVHGDSDYTKERGGGLSIKCPHCGEWNASHAVQHEGCECGAEASMWARFDPPDDDSDSE